MSAVFPWSRMSTLDDSALIRLYDMLVICAAGKNECPRNTELATRFNLSPPSVVRAFHVLEMRGMISVERFMNGRVVKILKTGKQTSFDGKRTPHWSAKSRHTGKG